MIPILVVAGIAAAAGVLIVTFWDELKSFLKKAFEKVKEIVKAAVVGFVAYVKSGNIAEGIKAAYKFYSKDKQGQWQETVVTKTISANDVPEQIRNKLENSSEEVDISKELELELA